ncbi:MAG TPA: septum formation initiator family protein [Gaiellaceae bacterium]|jgi:cell division protein FtsL|nr:septum formation initiator family protein [Gaiellaceae bacterium]
MVAWVEDAVAERAPAARPIVRPRPRPRARSSERRLAGGVLWIVALAVLLVGVVALNVAVLRLNMQLEQLSEQRLELEARNALLESKVSATIAQPRVERLARTRLGLVRDAEPAYVELSEKR